MPSFYLQAYVYLLSQLQLQLNFSRLLQISLLWYSRHQFSLGYSLFQILQYKQLHVSLPSEVSTSLIFAFADVLPVSPPSPYRYAVAERHWGCSGVLRGPLVLLHKHQVRR